MEQHERVAIIGTAHSWVKTPWTDPGLYLVSLNDAYRLPGFQRADRWYDLHPLNKFYFVDKAVGQIAAHQVPVGHYVRPRDHVDWLAKQSIPVVLARPEDHEPPEDYVLPTWPHLRPFPKRAIEAQYGRYFTSSPAWMIAHAVLEGVRELHIYGIHLATEHEYIEQRPNFEFLIGSVLGSGRRTLTVKDGLRHYETATGHVVLPEASPILGSDFQYAFQQRPRAALEPLKWEAHKITVKRARALTLLRTAKPWTRTGPAKQELAFLDAWDADVHEQMARIQTGA